MVLALWLALAATDPPPPLGPTAVVLVRRTSVKSSDARELARVVNEALVKEGVELAFEPDAAAKRLASVGVKSPERCAGRRECIHEFARQLKVQGLVTVSISQLGGERALGVELYSTVEEKVLLKDSILFPAKEMPSPDLLQGFARKVRVLAMGEPEVVPDKPPGDTPPGDKPPGDTPPGDKPPGGTAPDVPPADPNLKNPQVKDPPVVVAPVAPPKSHTAGLVTGGAAIAAAVAAGALTAFAMINKADLERTETLPDGTRVSPHTTTQAQALRTRSNTFFTAAAACGGGALALGATAVFVW